jgi:hypothetical protein
VDYLKSSPTVTARTRAFDKKIKNVKGAETHL